MNKEEAKEKIKLLVDKFNRLKEQGKLSTYKEENTKAEFIEPLFEALGWDVRNIYTDDEVKREEKVSKNRVDYVFRINSIPKFYLEAKAIKEDLDKIEFAKQAIDYAYFKNTAWAVLTDFQGLKIFNSEWKGDINQCKFKEFNYYEYLTRFDELYLLSKESMAEGELDKKAEEVGKKIKKLPIDKQLLQEFTLIREKLTKDIQKNNPKYSEKDLDEIVQRILDRLIFIRSTEDRQIEEPKLLPLTREYKNNPTKKFNVKITELYRYFDETYNSKLFSPHECEVAEITPITYLESIESLYHSKDNQIHYNFGVIEADILGQVYEQYLGHLLKKTEKRSKLEESQTHRKEQGIYYTPKYIVDYIVKNTIGELAKDKKVNLEEIKILDPACGSGSFITAALEYLDKEIQAKENKKIKKTEIKGTQQTTLDSESKNAVQTRKTKILVNSIYGVDLDKQAVEITQLNLLLRTAQTKQKLPMLQNNIKNGNSLIDDPNIAGNMAFNWEEQFPEIMKRGGFDVIIGNPPYFNLSKKDGNLIKEFSEISDGIVNIAAVFIKKADKLLKEDGYLGFIVPKSILTVDSWSKLREFLLNERKIEKIQDMSMAFEDVGLEQVIIIFKKTKPIHNNMFIGELLGKTFEVEQEYFKKKRTILTCLNDKTLKLIKKIENNSILLGTICEMPRGITVNSKEYSSELKKSLVKVLGGTSVERYLIKDGNKRKPNRYLDSSRNELKSKETIFKASRIIYQNVASSLPKVVATLVENEPTDDTLNNVINDEKYISNLDLLGLLNSNLITFYLRYGIINCSKLTIHLDKPYLGKLPIKITKNLRSYVIKILELKKKLNEINSDSQIEIRNELKELERNINAAAYALYGLTEDEKNVIEESLK